MPTKTEILQSIVQATRDQDTEAFLAHLTEDVEYHYHVTSRPLLGKAWVRKFMDKYRTYTADVVWEVLRTAEGPDFLMVEGREEYTDTRSGQRVGHPYMGILEFRGDQVAKWRDYFEMNPAPPAARTP